MSQQHAYELGRRFAKLAEKPGLAKQYAVAAGLGAAGGGLLSLAGGDVTRLVDQVPGIAPLQPEDRQAVIARYVRNILSGAGMATGMVAGGQAGRAAGKWLAEKTKQAVAPPTPTPELKQLFDLQDKHRLQRLMLGGGVLGSIYGAGYGALLAHEEDDDDEPKPYLRNMLLGGLGGGTLGAGLGYGGGRFVNRQAKQELDLVPGAVDSIIGQAATAMATV